MNGRVVGPLVCVPVLWLILQTAAWATTSTVSPCDINNDGRVSAADVQSEINQALGATQPVNDMNGDQIVNVVDIQIIIDGTLGFGCAILSPNIGPHISTSRAFSVYNQQPAISNPQTAGPLVAATASFSVYNQQPALSNPQTTGPLVAAAASFSVYNQQPALSNPAPAGYPPFAQSLTYSVGNGTTSTQAKTMFWLLDSDRDGLPDFVEMALHGDRLSTNPDGDDDGDGLTNLEEYCLGTDPQNADTDGDGIPDGEEVLRRTNPLSADSDGDGYTDWEEIQAGTDPLDPNSHPAYSPLAKPAPAVAPRFIRPSNWLACDAALEGLEKRMNALRVARGMKPSEKPVAKEKEEK
jgi:hypothetical protein